MYSISVRAKYVLCWHACLSILKLMVDDASPALLLSHGGRPGLNFEVLLCRMYRLLCISESRWWHIVNTPTRQHMVQYIILYVWLLQLLFP